MKLLTVGNVPGLKRGVVVDSRELPASQLNRLLTLGLVKQPTIDDLREAAQERGVKGWHNMKRETLEERLSNG